MLKDLILIIFFGPALGILTLAGQSFSASASMGILFLALAVEFFYLLALVFAFRWAKEVFENRLRTP